MEVKMKIVRLLFKDSVVIFISGFLLSTAIKLIFGDIAGRSTGILIASNVLFVVWAIVTLREFRKDLDERVEKIGTNYEFVYDPKELYSRITSLVQKAQKRVWVISIHYPSSPRIQMPDERPAYLTEIEKIIQSKLKDNSRFEYKRVLQTENAAERGNAFSEDLLNEKPPQTFLHYQRIFSVLKKYSRSRVAVELHVCPPIASFPSLIIIDDRYFAMAFITPHHEPGDSEQHLEVYGGLFVEDPTGQKISEMEVVFNRVSIDSTLVYGLEAKATG
jgi:hypothetical protein